MFTFRRPSADLARRYVAEQRELPFSYSEVGVTDQTPWSTDSSARHPRFVIDRHRVALGRGEATFDAARQAIRQWRMFPPEMTELFFNDQPIVVGTTVAVSFRAACCWSLNAARIVYTVDDQTTLAGRTVRRFAFAYGTLPGHLECGEERFEVAWDLDSDEVAYALTAFSRPQHWLVWLGYPYARLAQRRFRILSGRAMAKYSTGAATD